VKVVYDKEKIGYDDLVDQFFKLHNYRHETKAQYMSAIFPQSDEQRAVAEAKIKGMRGPVATKVIVGKTDFHDAEEYHQHFLEKRKNGGFFFS